MVRITDNGCGRTPDQRPTVDSFGLLGIRERAGTLRGDLQIRTAPDHGFAPTVSLPPDAVEASTGKSVPGPPEPTR
ncbi:hypothetical protein OH764_26425 [Burkholderia sp. M6-3]